MLLAIFVCEPAEAEKSEEGDKSLEPMKPPDQASEQGCLPEVIPTLRSPPTNPVPDQGCLPEVIPTLRLPPTNPVPDQGCLPEVIPTLRSPPTNPVPEKKIGPIYQCPKLNLKKFQPLPKTYIPIYPCLKELLAELEVQDSTKKTLNQSDKDPTQSGNIPSKDKIIKKKVTFRVIYPSPLPQKDWYLSLQVKEGSVLKETIEIKTEKTSKKQKLTWTPLIFNVGKDDAVVFSVMKKITSSVSISEEISFANVEWYPDKFQKNGKFACQMKKLQSILPGLKVEYGVEDILETIEKPDSGQNKTQKKINSSFFKNKFLHLKERLRKRRST